MIHTQRQKPRTNRRETRSTQTPARLRIERARPRRRRLDGDTAERLLDRRAHLRPAHATRDEQATARAILKRRQRQRNPRRRTEPRARKPARQRAGKRLKPRPRDLLAETQFKPAARRRRPHTRHAAINANPASNSASAPSSKSA